MSYLAHHQARLRATLAGGVAPRVPRPFMQYLPENWTASGCVNTGTGGSGYDLYLPAGVTAPSLVTINGKQAVRLPADSYLSTRANMPASLCGQSSRTTSLLCRVAQKGEGLYMGWGVADLGRSADTWFNPGAGIVMYNTYGAGASLADGEANKLFACFGRMRQIADGWQVQAGVQTEFEPTITSPVVNTASTPFRLGKGNYADRAFALDVLRVEIWPEFLSDAAAGLLNDTYTALGAPLPSA